VRFPTVKIDYTYYTMPTVAQLAKLLENGPELTFSIKAHEIPTHEVNPAAW
jgi:uncharacterized protein YecE (DUF72 family)